MAQQSYPFDSGAGAAINEAQWQAMARRFLKTGVIEGSLNQLAVTADGSALAVTAASGDAFIEGFFYRNDSALSLTIATANATNPRIDTVVVRLDRTANTAVLAVITGTAATSPTAPALTQTDALYELPLANVRVPAAAGVIVAADVTDRRSFTRTFDSAAYVAKGDVASARVDTSESSVSRSFADLATVGPAVTVTTGTRALVLITGWASDDTAAANILTGVAVSGATTRAAADADAAIVTPPANSLFSTTAQVVLTGLTAGSNTFTLKYRSGTGTATWSNRKIVVIPL